MTGYAVALPKKRTLASSIKPNMTAMSGAFQCGDRAESIWGGGDSVWKPVKKCSGNCWIAANYIWSDTTSTIHQSQSTIVWCVGFDTVAAAAFNDRVDDRATFSSVGVA